ncbi:microsomal signal peptidase 25 kDa subunit [Calocera viscosa TUFC12733]|uniref:Signal peptidase complex subunit 2 n=1 Tax=Calocera viscosa (strain TUFC12733) TaxID=1330018 RepID=A0A167K2G2_CALVF|nr:microsomal signal peptidase 25 kDa subunit [Calocera viscosa TUFC12733]
MAAKKRRNGEPSAPADVDTAVAKNAPTDVIVLSDSEPVKINNAHMREIKDALDDAIRRMLTRPDQFKQNHMHTDVKLALGWGAVLVAGATGLYGYFVEFEKAKIGVAVGVVLYGLLSTLQYLYQWFVEKDIVFVGKRRSVAGRIETERIILSSKLNPKPRTNPTYTLTLSYNRTTNSGKTLLHSASPKPVVESPVARWFDKEGNMDVPGFERYVGDLVAGAMGVKT